MDFHLVLLEMSLNYSFYFSLLIFIASGYLVGSYFIKYSIKILVKYELNDFLLKYSKTLSYVVIIFPICIYMLLYITSSVYNMYKIQYDIFYFSLIIGLCIEISTFTVSHNSIQLIVNEISHLNKQTIVNIKVDNVEESELGQLLTIGLIKQQIAQELMIKVERIQIETGQGNDINDNNASILSVSSISTDFFGYKSISIFISIHEENQEIMSNSLSILQNNNPNQILPFLNILNNHTPVFYNVDYLLSARIPFTSNVKSFWITCVEKFAAASPAQSGNCIQVMKFKSNDNRFIDNTIDPHQNLKLSNSTISEDITSQNDQKSLLLSTAGLTSYIYQQLPKPTSNLTCNDVIRHNDIIYLVCNHKYLSISRGWYLSWSSKVPRRSGAFRIEIIERIHHNNALNIKSHVFETINKIRNPSKYQIMNLSSISHHNLHQMTSQQTNKTPTHRDGYNSLNINTNNHEYHDLNVFNSSNSSNQAINSHISSSITHQSSNITIGSYSPSLNTLNHGHSEISPLNSTSYDENISAMTISHDVTSNQIKKSINKATVSGKEGLNESVSVSLQPSSSNNIYKSIITNTDSFLSTNQNNITENGYGMCVGDTFRLRSVKFPDYELGITNTRINNEYCYLGLRKVRFAV